MDRIQPGVVIWKRVNANPKNRYKKVENGNYVIDIAKVSTQKRNSFSCQLNQLSHSYIYPMLASRKTKVIVSIAVVAEPYPGFLRNCRDVTL